LFVRVRDCGELLLLVACSPNSRLEGARSTPGALPSPDNPTV
jgi:hypothetical protein